MILCIIKTTIVIDFFQVLKINSITKGITNTNKAIQLLFLCNFTILLINEKKN